MKLWFQPCGNLGTDPLWKGYEECLDRHLHKLARPGTEISIHSAKVFSPGVVSYRYDAYLHTALMIDSAIQAEREGYDAFVLTGTLDPGYFEIKEAVHIPVIFPIETALHMATLLAPKVAFLVMNPAFLDYLNDKAISYGFQDRLTPGGFVNISMKDLQLAFKNPKPVINALTVEAKRIGEQGANILICAGNPITMLLVENGATEIGDVAILDSLGILVKAAEMMVDLQQMGVIKKRMGTYSPRPQKEIADVRKLYGIK